MKTKFWSKLHEFSGLPKLEDFEIIEEDIDEDIADGELLTQVICIGVDPYTRIFPIPPKVPVSGFQASRVLKSKSEKYPEGSIVMFEGGWKTVCRAKEDEIWYRVDTVIPEKDITRSVGVFGMAGLTAYLAFLGICKPQAGETVMVNSCVGSVGSIVGQIAKIKGCTAVGCCGSEEKMKFAKSIKYDEVFNYKTDKPWIDALKRVAPKGIDCFFDNVSGQLASDTISQMNLYGRIACVGAISTYNAKEPVKADVIQTFFVAKQLKMEGYFMFDPRNRAAFPDAVKELVTWVDEGKIKVEEKITNGFENVPKAFIDMLSGATFGKSVIKM